MCQGKCKKGNNVRPISAGLKCGVIKRKVKFKQLVFSTKDSSTAGAAEQTTPVHVPPGIQGADWMEL